jgi:anti-sigma28 factor (negative regulator of flagellin synthesis)
MSGISGIGGNTPVNRIASQPIQKQVPATPAKMIKADKVEISTVKQLLATLKAGGPIRADKVAAIKAQLAAGTYETSAKLDAAIEKLMNDL